MNESLQRDLESRLRDAYRAFRERRDPSYVMGPSTRQDAVWKRTAEIVDRIGADPFEYIRFQFDSHAGSHPQYKQLASEWAVTNYNNLSKTLRQAQGIVVFERQLETLLACINGGSEPDVLLWDPTKEFSSIVRICMCTNEKLDSFLARFGDHARRELDFDRPLREYINQHYHDRAKSAIRAGVPIETPSQPLESIRVQAAPVAGHLIPTGPRCPVPPRNPPGRPYLHE